VPFTGVKSPSQLPVPYSDKHDIPSKVKGTPCIAHFLQVEVYYDRKPIDSSAGMSYLQNKIQHKKLEYDIKTVPLCSASNTPLMVLKVDPPDVTRDASYGV